MLHRYYHTLAYHCVFQCFSWPMNSRIRSGIFEVFHEFSSLRFPSCMNFKLNYAFCGVFLFCFVLLCFEAALLCFSECLLILEQESIVLYLTFLRHSWSCGNLSSCAFIHLFPVSVEVFLKQKLGYVCPMLLFTVLLDLFG